MIVNTSPYEIVLPKDRQFGEIKPLRTSDDPVESLTINGVTYIIDSYQVTTQFTLKILPATKVNPSMTQNLCQKPQF